MSISSSNFVYFLSLNQYRDIILTTSKQIKLYFKWTGQSTSAYVLHFFQTAIVASNQNPKNVVLCAAANSVGKLIVSPEHSYHPVFYDQKHNPNLVIILKSNSFTRFQLRIKPEPIRISQISKRKPKKNHIVTASSSFTNPTPSNHFSKATSKVSTFNWELKTKNIFSKPQFLKVYPLKLKMLTCNFIFSFRNIKSQRTILAYL